MQESNIISYIEDYKIIKCLGRGKSAYSYLVKKDHVYYVYKQMHQEHIDYYHFNNKLENELKAYEILKFFPLKIPKLISYNLDKQYLIKEYIEGQTLAEQISLGVFDMDAYITLFAHALVLEQNQINIDYFPTNFIYKDNEITYIDYEVNAYDTKWDFIHWGSLFLFHQQGFKHYLKDFKDTSLLLNSQGLPIIEPIKKNHEAFIGRIKLLPILEILNVLKSEESHPEIQQFKSITGGFASHTYQIKTKNSQYFYKVYHDVSQFENVKLEIKAYQYPTQNMPRMINYKIQEDFIWIIFEFIEGTKTIELYEKTKDIRYIDDFTNTLILIHENKNSQTTHDFIEEECRAIETMSKSLNDVSVDSIIKVLKKNKSNIQAYKLSRLHGDYHPWNTIHHHSIHVVDWIYRYGDFRYEVMWTYGLLYRSGYEDIASYFLNQYQEQHPFEDRDFFLTLSNLRWFLNVKTSLKKQFNKTLYDLVHSQTKKLNELNILCKDIFLSFDL